MRLLAPALAGLLSFLALGCTTPPVVPGEGLRTTDLGPRKRLYPNYVADPRPSVFGLSSNSVLQASIDGTGDQRIAARMGGRVGLFRYGRLNGDRDAIQVEFELSYHGWFDGGDNLGWDETYGLFVAWKPAADFVGQVGLRRRLAKLDDGFADANVRTSLDYDRDELVLAGAVDLDEGLRVYGEYGHGIHFENSALMERRRFQGGIEVGRKASLFQRPLRAVRGPGHRGMGRGRLRSELRSPGRSGDPS